MHVWSITSGVKQSGESIGIIMPTSRRTVERKTVTTLTLFQVVTLAPIALGAER